MFESNIEIVIHKKEGRYHATCLVFPGCKGTGASEQEAISKLCRSIGRKVSKLVTGSLESLLQSDAYTDIILDPNEKENGRRRVYNMNASRIEDQGLSYRFSILPESMLEQARPIPEDAPLPVDMMRPRIPNNSVTLIGRALSSANQEGFVFGFPLSFN